MDHAANSMWKEEGGGLVLGIPVAILAYGSIDSELLYVSFSFPDDCPADKVGFDEGCYWLGSALLDYAGGEAECQAGGGKLAVFYRRADVPHAAAAL